MFAWGCRCVWQGQDGRRCRANGKKGATLFFAGDSTLDDNGFHPYRSWGLETAFYMKAGNVVTNFAKSGASTKSLVANGYWNKLITNVKAGDFVPASQFPVQQVQLEQC